MATFTANCNKHQYSVEGDLFVLRPMGEMTPVEARSIADAMLRAAQAEGRIFILLSLDGVDKPPPETRQVISASISELPLLAIAHFGGSLVVRTLMILINRATTLLRGSSHPIAFFATESEARTWLAELRARSSRPK